MSKNGYLRAIESSATPGRQNVSFTVEFNTKPNFRIIFILQQFCQESKKCFLLCFPWKSETCGTTVSPRLHPQLSLLLVPNRDFPPTLIPHPGLQVLTPEREVWSILVPALPMLLNQEPGWWGPAAWLVTVPIPAAPGWSKTAWQHPHPAPSTLCALVHILVTLLHINNL